MVVASETCATAPPPGAVTLATREEPADVWQSASSPIVPWLSAAPTPRPSTDARATAKSLSELVRGRRRVRRQHAEADLLARVRAQRVEDAGLDRLQRAVLRLARRRVDAGDAPGRAASRIVMWPWYAPLALLAAGAADDRVLAGVRAVGLGSRADARWTG